MPKYVLDVTEVVLNLGTTKDLEFYNYVMDSIRKNEYKILYLGKERQVQSVLFDSFSIEKVTVTLIG